MENRNILNDKELRNVNGGMVAFLEDVSGCEEKVKGSEPDSRYESPRIPGDDNGKTVIG